MKLFIWIILIGNFLYANIAQVSALRGSALALRDGKQIPLKMGDSILEKDILKTAKRTKMQIIFKDKTVMTLGKESELSIEKYFFEKGSQKSGTTLSMKKGFFKTITGKIGKVANKNFKLKTKNSTIGIRGTQILANIDPATSVETIACTSGAITVGVGDLVSDVAANELVTVDKASGMSAVRTMTPADRAKLNAGFKSSKKDKKSGTAVKAEKKKAKAKKEKSEKKEKTEKKSDSKEKSKEKQETKSESKEASKESSESKESEKSSSDSQESKESEETQSEETNEAETEETAEIEDTEEQTTEETVIEPESEEVVFEEEPIAEDVDLTDTLAEDTVATAEEVVEELNNAAEIEIAEFSTILKETVVEPVVFDPFN
jgi:hypothetical protein